MLFPELELDNGEYETSIKDSHQTLITPVIKVYAIWRSKTEICGCCGELKPLFVYDIDFGKN